MIENRNSFSTHVFPTELLRGDSVEVGGGGDGLAVSLRTGVERWGGEGREGRGMVDMI